MHDTTVASAHERAQDPANGWRGEALDLDAYLARIGYDGPLRPDAATLAAVHRAHTGAIAFENADLMLDRPISLEVEDLQAKLVDRRRGGYCYEQNLLLAAALERLGFRVRGHAARVRVGGGVRPATHMLLTVDLGDEGRMVADVGFGGGGPLEPIPLRDGAEVRQGRWLFRLRHEGGVAWGLDTAAGAQWNDVHGFTDTPFLRSDYTIFSHYLSTHPRSPFRRRLVVQRSEDTVRHTLTGTRLTAQYPDGTTTTRDLDPRDVSAVLRDVFGIELDDGEASALAAAAG
ncbi:arylamine N-acetyltransferase [Nocardiopsis sp. HNM0947]|uniref:Arylamine N-acetyltransferase n=1 Tax=Nocardiopsis coralli TaxID=2772213 RepID=A0ABR9P498_9ACTN|nr:arylamine N-acetyltransferase [Nocardiopsis coralli]MBE2998664.1 arylamine N-acetyltransferase [Nocardiopsis coralli]